MPIVKYYGSRISVLEIASVYQHLFAINNLFLTAITLWIAYISKPIYPKQLHFDYQVKCANYRKKNAILLIIITIQIFCIFVHHLIPIIYLSFGIMVSLIGLLIEHVIQYFKRREKQ